MGKKIIYLATALALLMACSKSKSPGPAPPPPPATCGSKADCILGNWVIYSSNARLKNGSQIALYTTGSSSNLLDFANWKWIFTSDGKWTEYIHGGILKDSGRYVINIDTLFTKGKFPHSFVIADITNGSMSGNFLFDHANPDTLAVTTALAAGIDTANLNGITANWIR